MSRRAIIAAMWFPTICMMLASSILIGVCLAPQHLTSQEVSR